MIPENNGQLCEESSDICISLCAGTSFVKRRPCFSHDTKYLFVIARTDVNIYSTNTGELLHVLNNNDKEIVSCFLNPNNNMQLVTVSVNGVITFWDYADAILIRELSLKEDAVCCAFPGYSKQHFYVVKKIKETSCLFSFSISDCVKKIQLIDNIAESEKMISFSSKGKIATVNRHILNILYRPKEGNKKIRYTTDLLTPFTCVTWHPSEECIAAGDKNGRIFLWYNWRDHKNVAKTLLHWHNLAVDDITFTAEGSYLYSGGSEAVLVKWNPETQLKDFLPRLGMPICSVVCSSDSTVIATSLVDNTILLVNSSNHILKSINGLTFSHHWEELSGDLLPTGLLFEPHSQAIVLNGKTGHLQFFHVLENKHLYNLDITQQNYLGRERTFVISHLEVIKAAFDQFGNWLATVEAREEDNIMIEIRLKFYRYNESEQQFALCTIFEMPHEKSVNTILFSPQSPDSPLKESFPLTITTSDDKKIKFWKLSENSDQGNDVWTCYGVGHYHDMVPGSASFSEDGSVVAVAFNHVLTLWIPNTNTLKTILYHRCLNQPIKQVVFGRQNCNSFIASSTSHSVTVWDTLSLSVMWTVQVDAAYMVSDLSSNIMAIFSNSGELFIFQPSSPKPLFVLPNITSKKIIGAICLPVSLENNSSIPWLKKSQLYFMDSDKCLYTLLKKKYDEPTDNINKGIFRRHLPLTPYGMLLAENRKSGVEKIEQKLHDLSGGDKKKIIKMMLTTPCHVLPGLNELCTTLFDSLLKPTKNSRTDKEEVDSDQEASERGDDDDDDDDDDNDPMEVDKENSEEDDSSDEIDNVDKRKIETKKGEIDDVADKSCNFLEERDSVPESTEQELKAIAEEDYSWFLNSSLFT